MSLLASNLNWSFLLLPAGSITLGIRPEDWQILHPKTVHPAVIKRIENLGDHRRSKHNRGNKIIVKTTSTVFYENESIGLNLPTDTVHWFENIPEKESRLPRKLPTLRGHCGYGGKSTQKEKDWHHGKDTGCQPTLRNSVT